MSGDALAMKITCSGGDGCRCRTCGPTRKLFGEPSGKHHRCIADYSAMHRGIFGD